MVASYKLGVNAYVVKPVDFHEFFNAIKELGVFWPSSTSRAWERKEEASVSPLAHSHLEDDPSDSELDSGAAGGGLCLPRSACETEVISAPRSNRGGYDLILADTRFPRSRPFSVEDRAGEAPEMPFIFVSGTLDEELAIEALKIGATDYVFKTGSVEASPSVQKRSAKGEEKPSASGQRKPCAGVRAYLARHRDSATRAASAGIVSSGDIY